MWSSLPPKIEQLANQIRQYGGRTYLVGGCVRDKLMGRETKDFDVLVVGMATADFEQIAGKLFDLNFVGKSFGVYKTWDNGKEIDIAFPRREVSTGDGHREFEVTVDSSVSLTEDLQRRDFCLNSMAVELVSGPRYLIDYYGGEKDIKNNVIRQITPNSIKEDYLRALRAIQFASRFGFHIHKETFYNITTNANLIQTISGERIRIELNKLIVSTNVVQGFNYLLKSGLLERVLPEVYALNTENYNFIYHRYNTYYHTIHMLERYNLDCLDHNTTPDLEICWGILLHDIGKPLTTSVDEFGVFHNYEHELKSAELAEVVLKRLYFDNDATKRISAMVLHHMQTTDALRVNGIRRLMSKVGYDLAEKIYTMVYWDKHLTSHQMNWVTRLWIRDVMCSIQAKEDALKVADLAVDGKDLIALGYKGKQIGDALRKLLDLVIDNPQKNDRDTLLQYLAEK